MAIVVLPTPLRPYASQNKQVRVEGENVREGLEDLVRQYPGLQEHLFDAEGTLRPFVHLFLDGVEVPEEERADVRLKDTSRLMLVPSIAGGGVA